MRVGGEGGVGVAVESFPDHNECLWLSLTTRSSIPRYISFTYINVIYKTKGRSAFENTDTHILS